MRNFIKFLTILTMFTAGALAVSQPTSAMDNDWFEKPSSNIQSKNINKNANLKKEKNIPSTYLKHKRKSEQYNLKTNQGKSKTKTKQTDLNLESPTVSSNVNSVDFYDLELEIAKISGASKAEIDRIVRKQTKVYQQRAEKLKSENSAYNSEMAKCLLTKIEPLIKQERPIMQKINTNFTTRNQKEIKQMFNDVKKMQNNLNDWLEYKNYEL